MPKQYPCEVRQRAVRLVLEHRDEYDTEYAAIRSIGARCNVGTETLRKSVRQAETPTLRRGASLSVSACFRLRRSDAAAAQPRR